MKLASLTLALATFAGAAQAANSLETSFNGDLRLRGESWQNFGFGPDNDDDYLQARLRLRGAVTHTQSGISGLVELKSAVLTTRDLPGGNRTLEEDSLALQQAWIRLPVAEQANLTLGRQALKYGKQRLISPLAWSNTGRAWDGAKLSTTLDDWTVDAFYTWVVPVDKNDFNDTDSDQPFYGIYATHAPKEGPVLYDLYALQSENDAADRTTLGTRIAAKAGKLTAEVEAAYQTGDAGDLDVDAHMISTVVSYAPSFCPFGSTWSLGYDVSSGDDNATAGDSGTFHPLFPLGHAYHGYIDALGRRNLTAFSQTVALKACEKVDLKIAHHFFDRTETEDAVYHAGNGVLRAADSSTAEEIGNELDITIKYADNEELGLEVGYSLLFAGDVIDDASPGNDDIQFTYLSALLKF